MNNMQRVVYGVDRRALKHLAALNRSSVHNMAAPKSILSMGITAPPALQTKIDACRKQAVEAGYDLDMLQLDAANFPSEQERIKEALGSKRWDGVMVGFGVRGNPKLTDMFETLVNTASEMLPGIKFGFNSSPDDVLPCLVRNFGQKG